MEWCQCSNYIDVKPVRFNIVKATKGRWIYFVRPFWILIPQVGQSMAWKKKIPGWVTKLCLISPTSSTYNVFLNWLLSDDMDTNSPFSWSEIGSSRRAEHVAQPNWSTSQATPVEDILALPRDCLGCCEGQCCQHRPQTLNLKKNEWSEVKKKKKQVARQDR